MKSVCVKLQERCNVNKLPNIEDDNNMLLPYKLHSFGLATRTIEADFVAPRVNYFQICSECASRAWKKAHWDAFFHGEYQYKTSQSSKQTNNFVKPCCPLEWTVLHVKAL